MKRDLNVETVAARIGIPVLEWLSNCYAIATKICEAGLIEDARPRYGHYYGPVEEQAPAGFFESRASVGFCRHGWIEVPSMKQIVDPTRFFFECRPPYIFTGSYELYRDEYDNGGSKIREMLRANATPPRHDAIRYRELPLPENRFLREFLVDALMPFCNERQTITTNQLHYVLTLPVEFLELVWRGGLRDYVMTHNLKALIPLDNFMLLEERHAASTN